MRTAANNLKSGMCVIVGELPYVVTDSKRVKYGKAALFIRVELRDVLSGVNRRIDLNLASHVETNELITRSTQFLRSDADGFVFLDASTGEEITVPSEKIDDNAEGLQADATWRLIYLDGRLFAAMSANQNAT